MKRETGTEDQSGEILEGEGLLDPVRQKNAALMEKNARRQRLEEEQLNGKGQPARISKLQRNIEAARQRMNKLANARKGDQSEGASEAPVPAGDKGEVAADEILPEPANFPPSEEGALPEETQPLEAAPESAPAPKPSETGKKGERKEDPTKTQPIYRAEALAMIDLKGNQSVEQMKKVRASFAKLLHGANGQKLNELPEELRLKLEAKEAELAAKEGENRKAEEAEERRIRREAREGADRKKGLNELTDDDKDYAEKLKAREEKTRFAGGGEGKKEGNEDTAGDDKKNEVPPERKKREPIIPTDHVGPPQDPELRKPLRSPRDLENEGPKKTPAVQPRPAPRPKPPEEGDQEKPKEPEAPRMRPQPQKGPEEAPKAKDSVPPQRRMEQKPRSPKAETAPQQEQEENAIFESRRGGLLSELGDYVSEAIQEDARNLRALDVVTVDSWSMKVRRSLLNNGPVMLQGWLVKKQEEKISRSKARIAQHDLRKAHEAQAFEKKKGNITDPFLVQIHEKNRNIKLAPYDEKMEREKQKIAEYEASRGAHAESLNRYKQRVEEIELDFNLKIDRQIEEIKINYNYEYEKSERAREVAEIERLEAELKPIEARIAQYVHAKNNSSYLSSDRKLIKQKLAGILGEKINIDDQLGRLKKKVSRRDKVIAMVDEKITYWNDYRKKVGLKPTKTPPPAPKKQTPKRTKPEPAPEPIPEPELELEEEAEGEDEPEISAEEGPQPVSGEEVEPALEPEVESPVEEVAPDEVSADEQAGKGESDWEDGDEDDEGDEGEESPTERVTSDLHEKEDLLRMGLGEGLLLNSLQAKTADIMQAIEKDKGALGESKLENLAGLASELETMKESYESLVGGMEGVSEYDDKKEDWKKIGEELAAVTELVKEHARLKGIIMIPQKMSFFKRTLTNEGQQASEKAREAQASFNKLGVSSAELNQRVEAVMEDLKKALPTG